MALLGDCGSADYRLSQFLSPPCRFRAAWGWLAPYRLGRFFSQLKVKVGGLILSQDGVKKKTPFSKLTEKEKDALAAAAADERREDFKMMVEKAEAISKYWTEVDKTKLTGMDAIIYKSALRKVAEEEEEDERDEEEDERDEEEK